MKCLAAVVALLAGLAGACGDNESPGDDDSAGGELVDRLNAIPGMRAEALDTFADGYDYYLLFYTQPVDHADPDGATFEQKISLLHRERSDAETAPMITFTTGYSDYWNDNPVELAYLLDANQVSIEHRFFAESRPESADWSELTIEQMANDEHRIIDALNTIYTGPYVTTGASKGGMTAVFHRRFFPDDVVGSVPYVAPISFGAPDDRYAAHFATVGTMACREKVRALAVELLSNRRAMLEERAAEEPGEYTRVSLGAAVESSVVSLEFAFWQYYGAPMCGAVPATDASDNAVWNFIETVSPPSDNADASIEMFDAYYYQALAQLGYPGNTTPYLDPYLTYTGAEDYTGIYPQGVPFPTYDGGAAMHDIDTWVQSDSERLLFIYGEWDPWTAGAFTLGSSQDSVELIVPAGTHNAGILDLTEADRDAAIAKLAAWTGVDVRARMADSARTVDSVRIRTIPREPHIPPAMHVALSRAAR